MSELSVFISYRRSTDAARAVMLDRVISGTFNDRKKPPAVEIYRDTNERLGVPWPAEVQDRCAAADLVFVVVGPQWLRAQDEHGRRRIDQPDDWVRQEIELALGSGNTVIPIAFGGAKMPSAAALPDSIAELAGRRGVVARDEYPDDLQPVLGEIQRHLSAVGRHQPDDLRAGDTIGWPDPPLQVKPAPMSDTDIEVAIREMLPDWSAVCMTLPGDLTRHRVELYRSFRFRSFLDALAFMQQAGDFADKANHHPRWENIFRDLRVYLTTWDIGHQVSQLDVQLAQYFNRAYREYRASAPVDEPDS